MPSKRKSKLKEVDSDGSSSPSECKIPESNYRRPVSPFLNYYINQCRNKGPGTKMTVEVKRKLRAEFDSLSEDAKKPYIDETERQKEEYKLKKLRMGDEGFNEKLTINTRCSPTQMAKLISVLKETKKDHVLHDLGFGSLVHIKDRRLRRDMCRYIVENFDIGGGVIQFEGHSIPLSVKDVSSMLGLKNEGDDVDTVLKGTEWPALLRKYGIEKNVKFAQLEDMIKSAEADSEELKAFVLLYVLGVFLCPNSSLSPAEKYFNCLCEKGMTGKLNWAKHVHEYLIRGIKSYTSSDRSKGYFNGCLLLLEVRLFDFWSHVITGDFDFSRRGPRIKCWGRNDVEALVAGHKELRGPFYLKGNMRKPKVTDCGSAIRNDVIPEDPLQKEGIYEEGECSRIDMRKIEEEMSEIKVMVKGIVSNSEALEKRLSTLEARMLEARSEKHEENQVKIAETLLEARSEKHEENQVKITETLLKVTKKLGEIRQSLAMTRRSCLHHPEEPIQIEPDMSGTSGTSGPSSSSIYSITSMLSRAGSADAFEDVSTPTTATGNKRKGPGQQGKIHDSVAAPKFKKMKSS